jgi:formylglycine-generating enzyme required for sulfatase activity
MYPGGASPTDILDMAGTVWEWCRNAFDDPDNNSFPTTSLDQRAQRGGSWNSEQGYARSTARSSFYPGNMIDYFGFRVVCSSPSSGIDH